MDGKREREKLVRPDQIPSGLPDPADRPDRGHEPASGLRRSRLLNAAAFRNELEAKARELGFDSCKIVQPDAISQAPKQLTRWLDDEAHGDMDWMRETELRRGNPRELWAQVRSIIMLGMNYGPESDPLLSLENKSAATISVYARNRDYHDLIKGRLKMLAQWLVKRAQEKQLSQPDVQADVKVFVDTAPVMEKPLAAAAGMGWQGRHTNLVSREYGSWLFLGSIFTTLDLDSDEPVADHCGSCNACLDICPTKAFPAPYRLDARRCISYLTIEHKGHIALEFRKPMGNRIYGCDDCLAICPWNKFAQNAREAKLIARADLNAPPLGALASLDDAGFRAMFSGSPVKRIGHTRFLRNILIAIGNSGDATLLPYALARLDDTSPLVRAMAVWAAAQLASTEQFSELRQARAQFENDAAVLSEWTPADLNESGNA